CLNATDYVRPLVYQKEELKAPVEKPLKERIQETTDTLAKLGTQPGGPSPMLFKTYRNGVSLLYGLKIFPPSPNVFKENSLPSPDELMVTPHKVDKKPLGEVL